jgi:hypothetical protein
VFLTIVPTDARLAATALAHNGSEGRLLTGSGAFSVRTGDFFAGKEREQLRLTAEGKLGLGVADPQAKLDVAGSIRTSEGIVFPDGTIQTTAFVASGRSLGERARIQRDAQGRSVTESGEPSRSQPEARLGPNGTFNRVAKFAADGTSLIDSTISEVGGNVGIGTTTPQAGFDYRGSTAAFYTRDIGTTNFGTAQSALQLGVSNLGARNIGVGPSMLFFGENSAGNKSFLGRVSAVWENPTAGAEAGALFFQVRANSGDASALTERMRITNSGRLGIGTNAPVGQLEVVNHSAYSMVNTAYGAGNIMIGRAAGGSQAAPAATTNGQNLLLIGGNGHTGAGFTLASSASVNLEAPQNWTNAAIGARITFGATENGTTNRVERMRIEHNGNVGIGTTEPIAKLHVKANGGMDSSNGFGIYGESNYFGVIGVPTGFDGAGIWGQSLDTNLAGYFTGDVEVSEMLSKGGGSFKIDHPLDPENKYLYHSFVESPDMKNIYDGTVTTDAVGEAEIVLPDWFEALNRDFRYQLTVIGQFAQAIVAEKIKDNRFKIRTSLPQVEVCWQVTGIRQDAFAEQRRIPVEELKPKKERGSYLHPAAFGQPEEKGVEWARYPEMMKRMKEAREKAKQFTSPVPESDKDRQR